jgi:Tol biopolymer transport system component
MGAAWSPLGHEIAFVSGDQTSNHWWIRIVPAEGGTLETIYAGNEIGINIRSLTWNTAGTHIAFIETDISSAERYIKIIERDTGDVIDTMLTGQYQLFRVDWARQGVDTLVFDDEWTESIYTIDIDTGSVETVTEGLNPCWSPDNSDLAFRTTGRKPTLVKYDISTGDITDLKGGSNQGWRR